MLLLPSVGPVNALTGEPFTQEGSPTWGVGISGKKSFNFTNNVVQAFKATSRRPRVNSLDPFSILYCWTPTYVSGATKGLCSISDNNDVDDSTPHFILAFLDSTTIRIYWAGGYYGNTTVPATGVSCAVFTYSSARGRLFVNGKEAWSTSSTPTYTGNDIIWGCSYNSSAGHDAHLGAYWPFRQLTDEQARRLSTDPWWLFAAPRSRIWFVPSAGGGAVSGTSAGTFTLTGSAAAAVSVSATSAATITVAGAAAGTVSLAATSAGTFTLTGTAEGAVGSVPMTATSSATISLTGTAAGSVAVSATSAGSFNLTGSGVASVLIDGSSAATISVTGTAAGTVTGGLETRYGRPTTDTDAGSWLPSTGIDLYAMVDEETADDGDYIYAESATTAVLKCTSLDTGSMTTPVLRMQVPTGFSASGTLTVALYQGNSPGTLVASIEETDPAAGLYEHTLTAGEMAGITDGTDLYFRVTAA